MKLACLIGGCAQLPFRTHHAAVRLADQEERRIVGSCARALHSSTFPFRSKQHSRYHRIGCLHRLTVLVLQNYLQQTNLFKSDEDLKDEFDDSRETVASLIQANPCFLNPAPTFQLLSTQSTV